MLTVQGVMPRDADFKQTLCADSNGFSLHAAVRCAADDRKALEQLCRYITRPALANERVQCNATGQVVLKLKTPWRDGTMHLVMSLLEIMKRLAALATPRRQQAAGPLSGRARERLLRVGQFRAASVAEGSNCDRDRRLPAVRRRRLISNVSFGIDRPHSAGQLQSLTAGGFHAS